MPYQTMGEGEYMSTNNSAAASAPASVPAASTPQAATPLQPSQAPAEDVLPEELEDLQNEPAQNQQEQKALEKAIRKLKLKVDGNEEDFEIDINDEKELIKHLQLSKVAQKRMNESAELKKQQSALQKDLQDFFTLLKTNPEAVLSDPDIGIDLQKFAVEYLEQQAKEAEKSPEQKEKEQMQKRLQELEDERKTEKEKAQTQEMERLQQQAAFEIEKDIESAINGGDLPKSPYVVKKMAEMMMLALNEGIDLTAKDVVPLVRQNMINDMSSMIGILPEEIVEQIVGKDRIVSLRRKQIKKLKETQPVGKPNVVNTGADVKRQVKGDSKLPMKDFFKKIGSF